MVLSSKTLNVYGLYPSDPLNKQLHYQTQASTMSETPTFTFDGKRIPIVINMKMVVGELNKKFNLNVLGMFASDILVEQTMRELVFEDEKTLQLMHFFLEKEVTISYDSMLNKMENLDVLDEFREAFWAAIVNFSGPLKKQALLEIWQIFKRELKEFKVPTNLDA